MPAIFRGVRRAAVATGDTHALRVLVVEDDRDTAESLRGLLVLYGYNVSVAHTSQQGIEAARKLEPHIVLYLKVLLLEMQAPH